MRNDGEGVWIEIEGPENEIQGLPLFEENGQEGFKGIDIMRTVRSFDPCLPCGGHMYSGTGKLLERRHSPMMGAAASPSGPDLLFDPSEVKR